MMNTLEHFLASPLDPSPRTGFQEEAWTKVLSTYQQTPQSNFLRRVRWLLPVPVALALSLMVFINVSTTIRDQRELTQLDKNTQQIEQQINTDPTILEVLNMTK